MSTALTLLDGACWYGEPLVGARPRALLEALAGAGEAGASEPVLIEAVWGADQPANPTKSLQVLVSRVRSATEPRVIERTPSGYRLGLGHDEVDVLLARDHAAHARASFDAGRFEDAAKAAHDALALGPSRDAQRVLALAGTRLGDHAASLAPLARLHAEQQDDEEVLASLLRSEAAVHGAAVALQRYDRYRTDLADRLGTDPGPTLQAVHRELLAADRPRREGLRYDGSPLLGRDGDVRALRALMQDSRLVSIVGPGGLGKTRLAHRLGRDTDRPHVHFVELVGVTGPEHVVAAIGSALGVRDSVSGRRVLTHEQRADVRARIAQHLEAAPTLLILDNCEHVIGAVADLAAYLVATTRDLHVLTTSRAPLNVAAERVYPLERLEKDAAAELFCQRAVAARPTVLLDGDAVSELVTRLDGLPLAIELAAAKARVMSVEEIGRRLSDRFALLRGGDRAAPERHQTLHAVIDWSWNLLTVPSRRALMWLSTFQDGFTAATADTVVGEAIAAVEELVGQSLVYVDESADGVRYRMLETVREFALMRLAEAGEADAAVSAQRAWARAYARERLFDLYGPAQVSVAVAVRSEETNLSEVLHQSVAEPDQETAICVLALLGTYWMIRDDHVRLFTMVDSIDGAVAGWKPSPALVEPTRVALSIALTHALMGQRTLASNCRRLLEELGAQSANPYVTGMCTVLLALDVDDYAGSYARLVRLCEHEDRHIAMFALAYRAHALENDGDPGGAAQLVARSLDLVRPEDGPWTRAARQMQLAQLHSQLGRHDLAAPCAREALPTLDGLESVDEATQCRCILAFEAVTRRDFAAAEQWLSRIDDVDGDSTSFGARSTVDLGRAELVIARGDPLAGVAMYRPAVERVRAVAIPGSLRASGLEPWVLVAEAEGLTAFAVHGEGRDGEDLWQGLSDKVLRGLDHTSRDYPVLGAVLFGLGAWGLLRRDLKAADAVRLLVLADRFAYARMLPTMAWANVSEAAEEAAPGAMERIQAEYGERRGPAVLDEARAAVATIFAGAS